MRQIRLAAFLGLLLVVALAAQDQSGTLNGRVVGGDGFGLPGVTITISGGSLAGARTVSTNGNGDYRAPNLPPGEYTVTAALEGFATSQRRSVRVRASGVGRADFVLQLAEIVEEIIITTTSNAATSQSAIETESKMARGGIYNVWGFNVGPEQLASNPSVPFEKTVAGYSAHVEVGGEPYDAFPLFVSRNQTAIIVPSDTPLGEHNLYLVKDDTQQLSNPFRINIVDHQPGTFTHRLDGQNAGIFTRLDFSLITPLNPALPGDHIIGWGTGFGPGEHDDRPAVFDKRGALGGFDFFLGGVPIADDDILYIGSGGSPGVDQWIGTIPADAPLGCAVPFWATGQTPGGEPILANPVTIPIGADGSPCGNAHGFPSDLVDRLHQGPLNLTSTFVTELGLFDGDESADLLLAELYGQSVSPSTFAPPNPLGTCAYRWRPDDFVDPFLPPALEFRGSYTVTLPWAVFDLSENLSSAPFQELFSRPDPAQITDGAYTFLTDGFESGNSPTSLTGGGNYIRKAGRLRDAVEDQLVDSYRDDGFVSISEAIDAALQAGGGEPGTVFDYQLFSDRGPLGTDFMRCFSSAESGDLAASRDQLVQQAWEIMNGRFGGPSEDGGIVIRFFDLDTNRGPRGPGIDSGEEIFDALISLRLNPDATSKAVLDCPAFNTCP